MGCCCSLGCHYDGMLDTVIVTKECTGIYRGQMWVEDFGSLLGVSLPARHVRIALAVFVRGRQVLSISSCSPCRVLRAVEEMCFLAVESLDGAGPVAAVNALHRLALVLRLDRLELRVGVVVWWSRHDCDRECCEEEAMLATVHSSLPSSHRSFFVRSALLMVWTTTRE